MAKILGFGKYAGLDLTEIPQDYLDWLIDSRRKDLAEYEAESQRRETLAQAKLSLADQIVQAGYRELAKRFHPDAGGSAQEFTQLKGAHEQLKVVLKEIERVQGSGQN